MDFEITKMGDRGQVVIPKEFRESLGLEPGDKFMVVEHGDNLIFKRMKAPSKSEFEAMLAKSHHHAKEHNLKEKDLQEAVNKARSR